MTQKPTEGSASEILAATEKISEISLHRQPEYAVTGQILNTAIAAMALPDKTRILSFKLFPPSHSFWKQRCYVQLVADDTGFR